MQAIGTTTRNFLAQVDLQALTSYELQFRRARYELLDRLIQKGFYGCIVYEDCYRGDGVFTRHLFPIDNTTLTFEERGLIRLDALYDKTKLYPKDLPHITDRDVGAVVNNKARTNEVFSDIQPWSYVVESISDLHNVLRSKRDDELIVLKPHEGYGGAGVIIEKVEKIKAILDSTLVFPLLVQEFIESSYGAPSISKGRHDVRVLLLNGEVLGGSVREPAQNGYLSNTHQGGSMRMLSAQDLPASLLDMAQLIDARLPQKPRLYAADFIYSAPLKKWYLLELNASPGALPSILGTVGKRFQEGLTDALIAMAKY